MIEQFDCGLPATIYDLNESWHWYAVAAADARLHDLADYLGTDLQIGRADGVFMTNALFDEMLKILYKFFSPAEIAELEPVYPLEEVLFPTVLPALLGLNARFCSTRARVWDVNDPPNVATMRAAIESGLHAAGKRVPQTPGHPVRQAVLDHLPGHLALNACLGTTIA
jgi:hypothetical protein